MGSWRNWRNGLVGTSGPVVPYGYYPQKKMRLCARGLQKNWKKSGLFRIPARILNDCLKVTRGDALIRIQEGKVRAVHGGDERGMKSASFVYILWFQHEFRASYKSAVPEPLRYMFLLSPLTVILILYTPTPCETLKVRPPFISSAYPR